MGKIRRQKYIRERQTILVDSYSYDEGGEGRGVI